MARTPIRQNEASPRGAYESLHDGPVSGEIRFVFGSFHPFRRAANPVGAVVDVSSLYACSSRRTAQPGQRSRYFHS